MKQRIIKKIIKGTWASDGAGVKLLRVFGHNDVEDVDPFLLLDTFDSMNPPDYIRGFPLHPHRGIETLTYLISGDIYHRDTLGNSGRIMDGQAQWMNSGSGIQHEEMPAVSKRLFGFQLWVNLPKKHKMATPTYHDINTEDMPVVENDGAAVRVVAGCYQNAIGAKGQFVQPLVLDISLEPNAEFSMSIPSSDTLFTYILEGSAVFGEPVQTISKQTAVIFGEGDFFHAKSESKGTRFMLFAGKPLHEPIAWGGPIVMNTRDELEQAFRELDEGTFIKS